MLHLSLGRIDPQSQSRKDALNPVIYLPLERGHHLFQPFDPRVLLPKVDAMIGQRLLASVQFANQNIQLGIRVRSQYRGTQLLGG